LAVQSGVVLFAPAGGFDIVFAKGDPVAAKVLAGLGAVAAPGGAVENHRRAGCAGLPVRGVQGVDVDAGELVAGNLDVHGCGRPVGGFLVAVVGAALFVHPLVNFSAAGGGDGQPGEQQASGQPAC